MIVNLRHPAAMHVKDVLLDGKSVLARGVRQVDTDTATVVVMRDENFKFEWEDAYRENYKTYELKGEKVEIVMPTEYEHLKDW